jgi:cysteine desulfurase
MEGRGEMIYLDYAATSPVDERVLEEMIPWFTKQFGNAASRTHAYGWEAEDAVKKGREQIADLIGAKPEEIIFTSGATEGINFLLKGIAEANTEKGNHIITAKTEHKAVLDTCKFLESRGIEITYLDVDQRGLINLEELKNAFRPETLLVSIMYANNETGVIQPIKEIAKIAHSHGAYFMTDATQAVGKIPLNVVEEGVDLLIFSSHKLYGPKGVGAVYIKSQYPKIKISPLLHGGGHEKGYRSGTLNVPGIVGLGKACAIAMVEMKEESNRLESYRNRLESALLELGEVFINGNGTCRLPHIINVVFKGIDAEAYIMTVRDRLAIANGSACTSAEILPSHVLKAMHLTDEEVFSAIRVSLGRFTKEEELELIVKSFITALDNLKKFSF